MGPVVLDASVLIAFFSSRDAHHDATALVRGLLAQRRSLLISAVTYAEVLVHPLREANERAIDEFLERARISIVPIDRGIAAAAARLRAFEALKLPRCDHLRDRRRLRRRARDLRRLAARPPRGRTRRLHAARATDLTTRRWPAASLRRGAQRAAPRATAREDLAG